MNGPQRCSRLAFALALLVFAGSSYGAAAEPATADAAPGRSVSSSSTSSQLSNPSAKDAQYACRPIGPCRPCPPDQLSTPACATGFGNRRLVHCVYLGTSDARVIGTVLKEGAQPAVVVPKDERSTHSRPHDLEGVPDHGYAIYRRGGPEARDVGEEYGHGLGAAFASNDRESLVGESGAGAAEFPTWEACERVVSKERADFFEFVLCNLAFAMLSGAVLFIRHRKLAARQYGRLAARIGIPLPFMGGNGGSKGSGTVTGH